MSFKRVSADNTNSLTSTLQLSPKSALSFVEAGKGTGIKVQGI